MLHAPRTTPRRTPAASDSPAKFGEIDTSALRESETGPDFVNIAQSAEFDELRSTFRRFVFPVCAAFLLWYLGYVATAAFFPEFMAIPVLGAINVGMLLGLGQFASTLLITVLYWRFAAEQIDTRVDAIHRSATGADVS